MTELIERVTRLETQSESAREDIAGIWQVLEKSAQTMQEVATQLATLAALSHAQHTPDNCPYRHDIRDCSEALWFARGGGRVVLWLLGGGLLSLGALLGIVFKLAGF